jgi:hypothetical protein
MKREPTRTTNLIRTSGVDPRVVVISRGDDVTREDRVTPGKTIEDSRFRRVAEKTQEFDLRKEKKIF